VLGRLPVAVAITSDELCIHVDRAALARMLELARPEIDEPLELIAGASKVREGTATLRLPRRVRFRVARIVTSEHRAQPIGELTLQARTFLAKLFPGSTDWQVETDRA
jgi:hypothetical protein